MHGPESPCSGNFFRGLISSVLGLGGLGDGSGRYSLDNCTLEPVETPDALRGQEGKLISLWMNEFSQKKGIERKAGGLEKEGNEDI